MFCPKCGAENDDGSKFCQKCGSVLAPDAPKPTGTSTGLEPNIAGLLCYVLGWITGLIFILLEKENHFIRFHAMQSIVTFGAITAVMVVLSVLRELWLVGALFAALYVIACILAVVLWIVLMVKAYQGERYKLPIAGEFAEKHI